MSRQSEPVLTPEILRAHLKVMANLEMSDHAAGMHELIAGLVAMMNALEPEGYAEAFPASVFRPIEE